MSNNDDKRKEQDECKQKEQRSANKSNKPKCNSNPTQDESMKKMLEEVENEPGTDSDGNKEITPSWRTQSCFLSSSDSDISNVDKVEDKVEELLANLSQSSDSDRSNDVVKGSELSSVRKQLFETKLQSAKALAETDSNDDGNKESTKACT